MQFMQKGSITSQRAPVLDGKLLQLLFEACHLRTHVLQLGLIDCVSKGFIDNLWGICILTKSTPASPRIMIASAV